MKKANDRVTEAYYDNLGKEFGVKVRDRIHWICENATGENILDVGCSQGITAILLGREGKKVCGLDLSSEAIRFANEMLANEEISTREHVEFYSGNFMHMDFEGKKFDAVIFGELLEHLTDPKRFIKRASDHLLTEDGKIIITLPFGINDYLDHKKTYYLQDVLDFQMDDLYIEEIRFLGKWIGIIMKKNDQKTRVTINADLLRQLESSFYSIERDLLSRKEGLYTKVSHLEGKVQELESQILSMEQSRGIIQDTPSDHIVSSKEMAELTSEVEKLRKKEKDYKQQLFNERNSKISVEEQLLASYKKEEALLKSYKKLLKRYESLSNSKLGRLTLSYWKKRKQLVRGK